MMNREQCVDCPKRTETKLGILKNACAKLALGRDFVADGCDEGPYVSNRVTASVFNGDISATLVTDSLACGRDEIISTTFTSMHGGKILSIMRDGEPLYVAPSQTETAVQ